MASGILSRSQCVCPPIINRTLFQIRHRSNKSGAKFAAQLIELDLADTASSASSPDISHGVRRLEDVIYNIIVRRSAPDWLPFIPGSSYWVPPRRKRGSTGLIDVIGNLAVPVPSIRNQEEVMAMNSVRGWPSSAYYIHGSAPTRQVPMDLQVVEVKFQEESENESQSEDDADH